MQSAQQPSILYRICSGVDPCGDSGDGGDSQANGTCASGQGSELVTTTALRMVDVPIEVQMLGRLIIHHDARQAQAVRVGLVSQSFKAQEYRFAV